MADGERTEGLSAADRGASRGFTAPALDRGAGAALPAGGPGPGAWRHRCLHRDRHGHGHGAGGAGGDGGGADVGAAGGRDLPGGETIEVSVTFSAPVTVTGTPTMTPTIGLEVGTEVRRAEYARNAGPAVLVFGYTVTAEDTDDGRHRGAGGRHPARRRDHRRRRRRGGCSATMRWRRTRRTKVDGSLDPLTGGVCERTPQVRDALVAEGAGAPGASNCSEVGPRPGSPGSPGALQLDGQGIAALKPGDFAGPERGHKRPSLNRTTR